MATLLVQNLTDKITQMRNKQQICTVQNFKFCNDPGEVTTSGVLTVWTHGGTPPAWGHYK